MEKIFNRKNLIILLLIIADIIIYLFLGVLQMDYDDSYNESKGEYWSLQSMNTQQKIYYFALCFWEILNIIFVLFFVFKLIIKFKNKSIIKA